MPGLSVHDVEQKAAAALEIIGGILLAEEDEGARAWRAERDSFGAGGTGRMGRPEREPTFETVGSHHVLEEGGER